MFELQRLSPDHEAALFDFEIENREYFARFISDRGDEFFEEFDARHRDALAEQASGICAFYVLADENGTIAGRFNLYDVVDGSANLGYRIGQRFADRGVATDGVRRLCHVAQHDRGLRALAAVTTIDNVASQRVLEKTGFVRVGPTTIAGREAFTYQLDLGTL